MSRSGLRLLALLAALTAAAQARPPRKPKVPEVVEAADGQFVHLHLKEDPAAQGWLLKPEEIEEDAKPGLLVALHGAGGNPKNYLHPRTVQERGVFYLAVAGHNQVQTPRGQGFQWGTKDAEYVAHLVRYLLAKHPIDKDNVIVWGHSAGGTMTLEALSHAPDLFVGGLTSAAPRTPDSRHADLRVAVILGKQDPNWSVAPSVRSHLERLAKKRKKGACAFIAVEGLGHEVPDHGYLKIGWDWVLAGKARGGEANVPESPRGEGGDHAHLMLRFKGAEGASGAKRSKKSAEKQLKKIRKEIEKQRAYFPFEVLCHSEHEETASSGGFLDVSELVEMGVPAKELKEGEVDGPLVGKQGVHLVYRPRS